MAGWVVLVWLFVVVVIVLVVVLVARALSDGGPPGPRGSNRRALDILEERYARGDIDRDDFDDRRRALGG
ncbi:MAG: SHOCT domain-containing protein [Actinomycetota bacterium]